MVFLIGFLFSIGNLFLRGFVIKTFWGWFVLSLFPSLPHLNLLQAIGLGLIVQVLCPWNLPSKRDTMDSDDGGTYYLYLQFIMFVVSLSLLVTGWVIHSLM